MEHLGGALGGAAIANSLEQCFLQCTLGSTSLYPLKGVGKEEDSNMIPRIARLPWVEGLFFYLPLMVLASGVCGEPWGHPTRLHKPHYM